MRIIAELINIRRKLLHSIKIIIGQLKFRSVIFKMSLMLLGKTFNFPVWIHFMGN